jgi:aromatic ring-cleaving dioxygenase
MPAVGVHVPPIYTHKMPATAWQLLWWLICNMDDKQEIRGGWRIAAARDMQQDRIWMGRCANQLIEHGLIDSAPGRRIVRVLVSNIVG